MDVLWTDGVLRAPPILPRALSTPMCCPPGRRKTSVWKPSSVLRLESNPAAFAVSAYFYPTTTAFSCLALVLVPCHPGLPETHPSLSCPNSGPACSSSHSYAGDISLSCSGSGDRTPLGQDSQAAQFKGKLTASCWLLWGQGSNPSRKTVTEGWGQGHIVRYGLLGSRGCGQERDGSKAGYIY